MSRQHVEQVRAALTDHVATSAAEERSRRQTLRYLDWLSTPLDERSDPTHVTASAIVVSSGDDPQVVLHLHKRLRRWLQPGGHVDPGESVPAAAVREVLEETGLVVAHPGPGPTLVHIDVHQGPRGHVHLDTRWLLLADPGDRFEPAEGESTSVGWFPPSTARTMGDAGMDEAIATAMTLLNDGLPWNDRQA